MMPWQLKSANQKVPNDTEVWRDEILVNRSHCKLVDNLVNYKVFKVTRSFTEVSFIVSHAVLCTR